MISNNLSKLIRHFPRLISENVEKALLEKLENLYSGFSENKQMIIPHNNSGLY